MSKISDAVTKLAEPIVAEEGCSLWDVEYVKEAGTWFLRVYIDKESGVSINDCENISRKLDPVLDENDPVPDSYTFEVCSAGADRILKTAEHFSKYIGSDVDVKLYRAFENSKAYTGKLLSYTDGDIAVMCNDRVYNFSKQDLAQVRLHFEF